MRRGNPNRGSAPTCLRASASARASRGERLGADFGATSASAALSNSKIGSIARAAGARNNHGDRKA